MARIGKRLLSMLLCACMLSMPLVYAKDQLASIENPKCEIDELGNITPCVDVAEAKDGDVVDANVDTVDVVDSDADFVNADVVVLDEPVEEDEPMIDELIENCTNQPVESLLDTCPNSFYLSNLLEIKTVGDPSAAHINLFNQELGEIGSYNCGKDKKHAERGKWKDNNGESHLNVIRYTKRIYSANIKFDTKYEGYRQAGLGVILERLWGINKKYKGTLLLDEYKHYPLWDVILKDHEELTDFLDYLSDQLAKRGMKDFGRKPVIRLALEDDPYLENLDLENQTRLTTLFEMVDPRDLKTKAFFIKLKTKMNDFILRFDNGDALRLGENMREKLFHRMEKYWQDFDFYRIAPWIIGSAVGSLFSVYLTEKLWKQVVDRLPDPPITNRLNKRQAEAQAEAEKEKAEKKRAAKEEMMASAFEKAWVKVNAERDGGNE